MNTDLFSAAAARPALELREHPNSGYAARTGENARGAGLTVAFAEDFTTAGEKLTKRVAGQRFVAIPLRLNKVKAAQELLRAMHEHGACSLNVAGNGIYTLAAHGWSQAGVNQKVYAVLARVHQVHPLEFIRSGGQTGVDTAGLVAGLVLNVPVLGLYPQGFRRRLVDGVDVQGTETSLTQELQAQAQELRAILCTATSGDND